LISDLNVKNIKDYAERETKRLKNSPDTPSLLPSLSHSNGCMRANFAMPEATGTGRDLLKVVLGELNRGVQEDQDIERIRSYFSAVWPEHSSPIDVRATPWSAAFLSWALQESGNSANFPMSAFNYDLWRYASKTKLTFLPGDQKPMPGDIVFRLRNNAGAETLKSARDGSNVTVPTHGSVVYSTDKNRLLSIGGDVRNCVAMSDVDLNDPRVIGFVRLPETKLHR
jgi:hypothetical protein